MIDHSKRPLLAVLVASVLVACGGQRHQDRGDAAAVSSARLAITHVTVIDLSARSVSAAYLSDRTVLVEGGRIAAVGPANDVAVAGARVMDGRGHYLIPGLWDAHAHVSYAGEAALPLYVANGITSVRDLGGPLSRVLAWRGRVAEGTLVGPQLYVAGPNLEGAWWLDPVVEFTATDSLLSSFPFLEASPRYRIATPADVRVAVDSLLRLGVDMIKFRNLRGDEFRALAGEARRRGVPLVGHAPRGVTLAEAADSGVASIEHLETVMSRLGESSEAERRAQFEHLRRAGTALTATMTTDVAYRQTPDSIAYAVIADTLNRLDPRRRFLSQEMLAFWRFGLDTKKLEGPNDWAASHRRQLADLALAHEAGVSILVGTDLGVSLVYPGFSVHEEMRYLVERGGLSPLDVLRGATVYPARTLGVADSVGSIAAGMDADLVLLAADPLRDVRNTKAIAAVVLNGRYFGKAALERLLIEAEEAAARR